MSNDIKDKNIFEYLREQKQDDSWEKIREKIREDRDLCSEGNITVPWYSKEPEVATLEEWEKAVERNYIDYCFYVDRCSFSEFMDIRMDASKKEISFWKRIGELEKQWVPYFRKRIEEAAEKSGMSAEEYVLFSMPPCHKVILDPEIGPYINAPEQYVEYLGRVRSYNKIVSELTGQKEKIKKAKDVSITGPVYDNDEDPSYFL